MNKKTVGYISIIALLSLTSFVSLNLFFQQRTSHDLVDIRAFPYIIGDWKGKEFEVTEKEYSILETRNLIMREYVNPLSEKLLVFIIYSETNRSVFHPPEVCLMGSGVEIVDKKIETLNYNNRAFSANKLYTEKDNNKWLGLYCYKADSLHTDKYYLQQAYFAFSQLFKKRVKGATIRVSMAVGENEETALATLKSFMEESARIIDGL